MNHCPWSSPEAKVGDLICGEKWRPLCRGLRRSVKQYQQIVLEKIRKNPMSSWLPFLKLKGLLAPEIFKLTIIRKFQKNVFSNLRLLNNYGLIISIKTNEKAFMCVCFIFKIGDATSKRICFPILLRALKWESRFVCLL